VALLGGWVPGTPDPAGLLRACGVRMTPWTSRARVVLVLSDGELAREVLDPLLRERTTHVVVRLVDGGAVLGPFVEPGVTACVRCIDAQRSILDPHHVAVTTRYVRASARVRADGVPDVADPALATMALAWGVREVVGHLAGRRPRSWSRTIELGADPSQVLDRGWDRHPECGCCWSAHDPLSGTMGA
jgi:bacteriocin biosynthesis cyclodehydratase domain-containing protein